MAKELQKMTPDAIRQEFIAPLSRLVVDFTHTTDRLTEAIGNKDIPRDYLEMNTKMAKDAITRLRSFFRREFNDKLEDVIEGTYRWRDAERKVAQRRRKQRR